MIRTLDPTNQDLSGGRDRMHRLAVRTRRRPASGVLSWVRGLRSVLTRPEERDLEQAGSVPSPAGSGLGGRDGERSLRLLRSGLHHLR